MTAGDMIRSSSRVPFTRQRFLSGREVRTARPVNLWSIVLLVGLTGTWLAVIWMAVFGSRPHTYLMILAGTYTIGVLSGAGFSGMFSRRNTEQAAQVSVPVDEPIDADVRQVH